MHITVIGTGYVGLVTGTCFADLGNHVTCVDVDQEKIAQLKKGIIPIYEPGLEAMVNLNQAENRLHFIASLEELQVEPQVIFIAVGTPSDENGSADMRYILAAAQQIGARIREYCVIVHKSTVPVGMADQVKEVIQAELNKRAVDIAFDMVSNPEFLREGAAIEDFMNPDRIIIGLDSPKAKAIMLDLYTPIMRHPEKIYFMNIKDAEMTKYAANAMLATKISFMNEMAVLCEKMGVDVDHVRLGIGADSRIGSAFIYPGCGYGGSCFPKDVKALIKMAEGEGIDPVVLHSVEERNFQQKKILSQKIQKILGDDLTDINIGIWGLAFKPDTDDMREAPSLVLIDYLIKHHAKIQAYDPAAMSAAQKLLPSEWVDSGQLQFADDQYSALENADALILVTEWKAFRYPDLEKMKRLMRRKLIIDGRNQYDPHQLKEAKFEYEGVGRVSCHPSEH